MPVCRKSFAIGWICVTTTCSFAFAQQNLPRPIVLYRSPAAASQPPRGPVTITTPVSRSSQTQSPARPASNVVQGPSSHPAVTVVPNSGVRAANVAMGPSADESSAGRESNSPLATGPNDSNKDSSEAAKKQSAEREEAAQQARPTNQTLQNPSGAYSLSHAGISTGQQMAPNQYFGPQFQNWTNQQSSTNSPASYGEMNRFQPGPFSGYVGPNTYVGAGFSNWNNLSSGSASANSLGGWSYSVWP